MPIGQAQNNNSSDIQETPVSMDNVRPEGTEYQYITSPSVEYLVSNDHMRRSGRIIKSPQRYNLEFGDAIEWKNDNVASIIYMI